MGQLVQVEHSTHLVDLAVALADDAAVVADHHVAEILVEGFGLRQPEAQAQLEQTLRPQVSQSKSLSHDIFKPPVRSLFLVGFRQIQIVLPDILQQGGTHQKRQREKGETTQSLSLLNARNWLCVLIDTAINHPEGFLSSLIREIKVRGVSVQDIFSFDFRLSTRFHVFSKSIQTLKNIIFRFNFEVKNREKQAFQLQSSTFVKQIAV